jgi:hypothetical protein
MAIGKYDLHIGDVSVEAVFNKLGGVAGAKRFLADELVLVEATKPEPTPEPVLDFTIRVDRIARPTYPEWAMLVMHPELEPTGPVEYDLQKGVQEWLAKGQKNVLTGNRIYTELKDANALESCLGLSDLLAIQAKGIDVFRKLYSGKAVFGWKSVVQYQGGSLSVPFLYEGGGEVELDWYWLGNDWDSRHPALRFSK